MVIRREVQLFEDPADLVPVVLATDYEELIRVIKLAEHRFPAPRTQGQRAALAALRRAIANAREMQP